MGRKKKSTKGPSPKGTSSVKTVNDRKKDKTQVQHTLVPTTDYYANPKLLASEKKRKSASLKKDGVEPRVVRQMDIKPVVEIDIPEKGDESSQHEAETGDEDEVDGSVDEVNDSNPAEENSKVENKPEEEDSSRIPRDAFPSHFSSASNVPRETADGKIIMVYVPQEKFPCPRPNCKQNFLTKENLDYHLVCSRIHNPQFIKDWGCRYCGKEFSGMSHVKQHEKMKHQEHDKEVCYECGKQFESLEKMKRHIDVHHLQKKYKCKDESCTMEFSSESGAKYHYKRVHLHDQIPCTIEGCPRKFDRNCDLRRHLDKAHRDGQLGAAPTRGPRKQLQQQQQQQPQQQQQHQQQQVLHVVETVPDQQQSLLPSQFTQEETSYTTMQTITQQMTIPAAVIPTTTMDPQQQLNQEQLQAIQSLQYLQQQQPPTQQASQFTPTPTSNYHSGYMY